LRPSQARQGNGSVDDKAINAVRRVKSKFSWFVSFFELKVNEKIVIARFRPLP
jgi:hypothetical protein